MTERELFLEWWDDNNLPYENDDKDKKVAWKAWQSSVNREGYKFVPTEPSKEMIFIGERSHYGYDTIDARGIYKAMIGEETK